MGSIDGRISHLEGRIGLGSEAEEARHRRQSQEELRAEAIRELNAFEHRIRSMSPEERQAWRNRPSRQEELEELEDLIRQRREDGF